MQSFDHMPYAAFASNWLTLCGCLAGLLTILGALNKHFEVSAKSQTKAVSRSQQLICSVLVILLVATTVT